MELGKLNIKPLAKDYQTVIGHQLAMKNTENNGVDEIFLERNNQKFIAYKNDSADLGIKSLDTNKLNIDGKEYKVIKFDNETNSKNEKLKSVGVKVLKGAGFDSIGGGVAGGLIVRLGLNSTKHVSKGIFVGALTAFVKEGVSITLAERKNFVSPDWDSISNITQNKKTATENNLTNGNSFSKPKLQKVRININPKNNSSRVQINQSKIKSIANTLRLN